MIRRYAHARHERARRDDAPRAVLMRRAGPASGALMLALTMGWVMAHAERTMTDLRRVVGLPEGPVYTVAGLATGLARGPSPGGDRPILVRAVATELSVRTCPYPIATCVSHILVLVDPGAPISTHVFLVWGLSDPLRASVRRLPVVARFVPPQVPRWGRLTTYRVALRPLWVLRCRICVEAVLLDASPVQGL